MRKIGFFLVLGLVLGGCGMVNPRGAIKPIEELKLEKYDFDNLRKRGGIASEIKILGNAIKGDKTKIFEFMSNGKKITGTLNKIEKPKGTIILIRGYVEKAGYYSGSGSWRVADELAKNGYMTFSIDFLGYGNSDEESTDVLESRFEKVESVMDLVASVEALPNIDKNKIGIWAHSNGGQIALSVLEVTGKRYPAVLWAPMTQKFPESVLSTIDEGSPVKEAINEFEKHYDARRYAFENYYQWISAPILIQQGTADAQVKVDWQRQVVNNLVELGKEAKLSIYEDNDHNLSKDWKKAVEEGLKFYETKVFRSE